MADSEEQVTSTTSFGEERIHGADLNGADDVNEAAAIEHFNVDDIVDLVGGAQDAIERHIAEESALNEDPELFSSQPEPEPEPVTVSEPVDVSMPVISEPEPVAETEESTPVSDGVVLSSDELVVEPEITSPPTPEPSPPTPEPSLPTPEPSPPTPEPSPPTPEPSLPSPAAPPAAAAAPPTREEEPSVAPASLSELLYWRDVKTTGVVFGAALLLLLSLTACSIVSVASYVGLALLSVTVAFRIYKGILQAIQKSDEGHPFKLYLNQEVALSEDVAHRYSDMLLSRINRAVVELRRLFLVDDLVDSIKFAVLMWILTYVGAFFNGLTLLILGLVAVFSCPIIYEKHQAQIDHYVAMVSGRITDIVGKIQAMVPGTKRKAE
ncbi:reticulon-3-like isoform X3 [Gadus chalcogrammus]|uniref:reticulon-3-like isoform X3 n=1 Tax=Gadus chalcogrammus TaxID=1042646 RepID=UPI0024C49753|nr:reticulon-3-like isoform X3 [Gadus chalcogrammus]